MSVSFLLPLFSNCLGFQIAFQVAGVKVSIFIIEIVLSAVGINVDPVWLQLCYMFYHLVSLHMCFIVGAINYHE